MKPSYLAFPAACVMFASLGCERKSASTEAHLKPPSEAELSPIAPVKSAETLKEFKDPSDGYFMGYLKFRSSKDMTRPEDTQRYLKQADFYFQAVKKRFPDWKPEMVNARIEKTKEALAKVSTPDH